MCAESQPVFGFKGTNALLRLREAFRVRRIFLHPVMTG
ncbi:hypothetical protein B0G84_7721 [Paraburkholderia sp. BL8N3]|nr:hypothetical protein B0G84_7721 [Paraburkholderia sp. BL8N3]